MNRIGAWGLAVAVGIAGAGALPAAEPTSGPKVADAKPWYQRLTGGGADAKKDEPAGKVAARPSIIIAPLTPEVISEAVKAEETACTRRLDACTKLRQFAIDKNDEKLLSQIDDLERQAIEMCQQRVARMGVKVGMKTRPSLVLDREVGASRVELPIISAPTPANIGGK